MKKIIVLENGIEYWYKESILKTDLVYYCEECGFYHLNDFPKCEKSISEYALNFVKNNF